MHTNHRRKKRSTHRSPWGTLPVGYCRLDQRLRWKRSRQQVREAIIKGRYEAIPIRYYRSIRWDYW